MSLLVFIIESFFFSKKKQSAFIFPQYSFRWIFKSYTIHHYSIDHYNFSMILACLFSLLLTLKAQIVSSNYFQYLPINSSLMLSANSAVNDLQLFLNLNFYCPSDEFYPGGRLSPPSQKQQFSPLNFQNSFNFGAGLQSNPQSMFQPKIGNCLSKQAYGIPSFTIDYFNPQPSNYINMAMLPYTKKFTLYNQHRNIISILSQIKSVIKQYGINNAVIGDNNTVIGTGNVVIGSNDTVKRTSNWILTSNYTTNDAQDGVLALGNYMIELTEYYRVLQNPSDVINCINSQEAAKLANVFWSSTSPNRRYCFLG